VLRLAFALVLLLLHTGPPPSRARGRADLSVIDVGQGQAVALRGVSSTCILIDAGGTSGGRFDLGERVVTPFLSRWGCRRVDALILTHDHDDHAGGAAAILRDFEVGELWIGAGSLRDRATHDLVADAVDRGVAVVLAERGLEAKRSGIPIEVLHPGREDAGIPINDRCVVVRAGSGSARVLIPGDLELEGERRLLCAVRCAEASALVVGHHGAARSTSTPFLAAVRPKVAVISVGRGNRFGHPDPTIVDRLARARVALYRTDRDGIVELQAGTSGWEVETDSEGTRNEGRHEKDEEQERDRDSP
jgi:competence protein ComEC